MAVRAICAGSVAALGVFCALAGSAHAQEFPDQSQFQKVTLNDRPGEPMSLAVLPDGRVLHSARTGEIRLHDPRTGTNNVVTDMKQSPKGLYQHDEEGVQGMATDPNFDENHWVYVYYAPKLNTPSDVVGTGINEGDAPEDLRNPEDRARLALFNGYNVLSRFKFSKGKLDFTTEQEILRVNTSRGICCHVGGKIDFDNAGNLYLSTGDDTNPFQSSGFTPIDDRENRNPAFDARRTSGNTNDLRGKILRIRVRDDGTYYVPQGNLFRPGQAQTRSEIYVMGLRNPFRYSVNKVNGDIYVGDYSPDSPTANPLRGPEGTGRWMIVRNAVNYGWPFCATPDQPYVDYDFTPDSEQSGEPFNCNRPINDSRNNTGLRQLPQVAWPEVWYSYNTGQDLFPELFQHTDSNGISPMGGPAMVFDSNISSPFRWPKVFAGHPLFYEWSRDYAKVMQLNRPNGPQLADIKHLFGGKVSENPNVILDNPMDMEFGPDNALYVLEYGTGYFAELPAAQLARIDYVRNGQYTPVVRASATPSAGTTAPLTVQFSSAGTSDANGDRLRYAWDFDSNGTVDSTQANPSYTYTTRGVFEATLRVTDQTGRSASWQARVIVGNQAPQVSLTAVSTTPPFNFGDTVHFKVTITDDQPVDCSRVTVAYILGHETHGHPQTSTAGCEGDISVPIDEGHAGASNLSAVFVAQYTDNPGGGETPLQGSAEVRLTPPAPPTNQG
ncbi:glucose/arabinose dehydrogenase [Solirubrobacter pauli]|uniref:Glucose/arabinose dehydrogenase n=1 Tax=Solirubrobacter pauli TaxID=166793 RepID=A0A660KZQ9_9ACTN|nr:PQQ-dependent sugar dehydrogenase [Solirubrobacter pauli]RKQ86152.1 glucose/arabinose dehydrogenase [Solirubrobacter pauli]